MKITCEVGALYRRHIRGELKRYGCGVTYTEAWGLLESEFVVYGPLTELKKINSVLRTMAGEIG